MDEEKRDSDGGTVEKTESVVGGVDEALKKCLEETKGDPNRCRSVVEAFKSSTPSPTLSSRKKPISPLRLRSGSLTDV